jgi:hypothetical protein
MEMRLLTFTGESYCDSDRQDALIKRTLEAIAASGVELEASDLSIDRSAAIFLVAGEPPKLRRLWSIIEATGLENAWESFGAQLDWQVFEMSR